MEDILLNIVLGMVLIGLQTKLSLFQIQITQVIPTTITH